MAKIIVTETFTRTYELEVADFTEETIELAMDAHNAVHKDKPQWVGLCVTDEDGAEVLEY